MTRPKPHPGTAAEAVRAALERECRLRDDVKPIEIVKIAISAYQKYKSQHDSQDAGHTGRPPLPQGAERTARRGEGDGPARSEDRQGLARGTHASIDHLLFNANYWCSAYEDRIVAACRDPEDARACLRSACVWTTHALRLNRLSKDDVIATFERFCPPFATNKRRGAEESANVERGTGKGPIADFERTVLEIAGREPGEHAEQLRAIVGDMKAEESVYERLGASGALDALFSALPAWCIQDRIDLVRGGWWDDCDVMNLIVDELCDRFRSNGYSDPACQYFADSCREAIDAYQRDISTEPSALAGKSVGELVEIVSNARRAHPDAETDGYGDGLPTWLISKEQLIWNILVCSVYGPATARPLLVDSPSLLAEGDPVERTDIITELAQMSFSRYAADRTSSGVASGFPQFSDQPQDLRNSSIEHIRSIPAKLAVLGYEIMPAGSSYPEQRVEAFTPSEVECLAILEHRRWLDERARAGWTYGAVKDVESKTSPYLVAWEELPDRAREWNRSAIRNIPSLLGQANLSIVRLASASK